MHLYFYNLIARVWIRYTVDGIAKCLFSCTIRLRCSIKQDSKAKRLRWIARWNKRVRACMEVSGGAHTYTLNNETRRYCPFFTSLFATLRTTRCYRRSYITNVGCGLKFKLPSRGATIIFPHRQGHHIVHLKMQSMQFHHTYKANVASVHYN